MFRWCSNPECTAGQIIENYRISLFQPKLSFRKRVLLYMSRMSFANMCRLFGPIPPQQNVWPGQRSLHRLHGESVERMAGGERKNVSELLEMGSEE